MRKTSNSPGMARAVFFWYLLTEIKGRPQGSPLLEQVRAARM